jgi:regulator of ribonuclease activity A
MATPASVPLTQTFPDFKTADLADRDDPTMRICDPLFRDFGGLRRFAGPVVTLKCFEDNSLVKTTLAEPGQGRVLVVDAGGSLRCAMLGDLLATSAVEQGWAGVILYGCIRDSHEIATMPLGVKALATHPRKSLKRGEGQRDIPVTFAGVCFRPDDWVYCDEDGILIVAAPLDQATALA